MNVLNVENLQLSHGADTIFDGAEFGLDDGEKVALVGPNGSGKTTLMRVLVGERVPDEGRLSVRAGVRIGYLPQDKRYDPDATARQIVGEALVPVREAIAEHDAVSKELARGGADLDAERLDTLVHRQHDLQGRIERLGGWQWEHRLQQILARLGVDDLQDLAYGALSGGQKRRVALARVLLEAPDLLLLDEPTNHLDAETVEWLEGWLKGFAGAVLFVSHDRYFLDRVADRILEIDEHRLFAYPGDFGLYMERKLARMQIRKATESRRQKLLEEEVAWLQGGKGRDRDANTDKRLREIEQEQSRGPRFGGKQLDISVADGGDLGTSILAGYGIHKSYDGREILRGATLGVTQDDKIGLVGPNGSGKTTMLRILVGLERPDAGRVEKGAKTEIGYLAQKATDIDPNATVFESLGESDYVWVGDTRSHKRDYLAQFLFDPRSDQKEKVSTLSGGQLRRLRLAKLIAENANVLVMDEPTNDLDLMSLQALEEALRAFEGCLVVASHDRYFMNRVCNVIYAFEGGKLRRYEGNYDDYKRQRPEPVEESAPRKKEPEPKPKPKAKAKSSKDDSKPKRHFRLTWEEKQELGVMEETIAHAEQKLAKLEEALADPSLYEGSSEEIESVNRAFREQKTKVEELYARWEALEARRR